MQLCALCDLDYDYLLLNKNIKKKHLVDDVVGDHFNRI